MADDGLDFMMELEAKLDGAQAMVRELRKVQGAAGVLDKHLKDTEKHGSEIFKRLKEWVKDFGSEVVKSFTGFLAAEAVWDSVKEGAHLLVELTGEMFHAAGEAERTTRAFENMLGVEVGDEVLDYLDGLGKKTEFVGGQLKGFSQDLLDAGFANDELKYALAATADVAARSKDKLGSAGNAIGILERVKLSGVIDARGLRGLKISPKAFYEQMAKDLGISHKLVQKKLEEGKIKTDDVLNSIYKAIAAKGGRGTLGAVGADMGNLFLARVERLKDALPNLFEEMSKTEGFHRFSDQLGGLAEDLQPDGRIGKQIATGLSEVFDQVAGTVAAFDWASGAQTLVDTLKEALDVVKGIMSTFNTFAEGYTKTRNVVRKVLTLGMAEDLDVKMKREVTEEINNSPQGQAWRKKSDELSRQLREQRRKREVGLGLQAPTAEDLAAGFSDGMTNAQRKARFAGVTVGKEAIAGAAGVLEVHSPSQAFARLGVLSAQGFTEGLEMRPPSVSVGTFMDGVQAPGGGGGPVSITNTIAVNVAQPNATAEEIGKEVASQVAAELQSQLEQLAVQSGSAYG